MLHKLELAHPLTMTDGSFVDAVAVRFPDRETVEGLALRAADIHDLRLSVYAAATNLPQAIVDEFDVCDINRLDDLLDTIIKKESA